MLRKPWRSLSSLALAVVLLAACGRAPAGEPGAVGSSGGTEVTAGETNPERLAEAPPPAAEGAEQSAPVAGVAQPSAEPTEAPATATEAPTAAPPAPAATEAAPAGDTSGGGGPGAAPGGGEGDAGSAANVAPAAQDSAAAAAAPPDGTADALLAARPPDWRPEDPSDHPLSIQRLRGQSYPGSDLVVLQDLQPGSNYSRQVVSYESEGNTIHGLFTVPNGEKPATGWPVVIFNHGYIPPAQYRTTERYVAYQDAFARAGYITLKSDYRGHGSSEGESTSGRSSPAYTTDVLNGMASVLRHPDADPNRVGMWGHSMGGSVTLRSMVLSNKIKAGVIWAGVVASYTDMYNRLGQNAGAGSNPNPTNPNNRRGWRTDLLERFGSPEENPSAWNAVSPNAYLSEISGPLQLHHGTNDHSVPLVYSERLQEQMVAAGRPSEIFVYQGDDHNLAGNLRTALNRSVEFFDQHVKGATPGG